MKHVSLLLFLVLISVFLAGCAQTQTSGEAEQRSTAATPPTPTPCVLQEISKTETSDVVIQTCKGNISLELYDKDAPKTVLNFAKHSSAGYYDGLTFHRVEPGFVIQGGDPIGNGTGGVSIFGATFEDELNPKTKSYIDGYKQGVLAMANRGPNTNGSQFFIMLEDNPTLPKNYTIFGKVTTGMDVVKQIKKGDKMGKIVLIKKELADKKL